MNTQLIKKESNSPLMNISDIKDIGAIFIKSGLFKDVASEAQAVVKIMAGREIGLEPFASMQGIDIIQGRCMIKPITLSARIKTSGKYNYSIVQLENDICRLNFFENGNLAGESIFNLEDAKKAGLAGKDNYQKHPQSMMFARAMSKGCRLYCPDLFMFSVYTEGEIDDVIETPVIKGNIDDFSNPKTLDVKSLMNSNKIENKTIPDVIKNKKNARPYPPEELKNRFDTKVKSLINIDSKLNNEVIDDFLLRHVNIAFKILFPNNDIFKKFFLLYIFTLKSSKDLNVAQARTMLEWITYKPEFYTEEYVDKFIIPKNTTIEAGDVINIAINMFIDDVEA